VVSHLARRAALTLCGVLLIPAGSALAQSHTHVGVVFIADGSGGLPGPTAELTRQICCSCPLLRAECVDWSFGPGWVLADLYAHGHHKTQGQALACRVNAYLEQCPHARIYLIGHSAGTAVILAACACLPPGSVTRVILLAPSVSCSYDLRPALLAAYEGVDAFYSHRDMVSLSMSVAPTADLRWFVGAAGYSGFRSACGEDAALYANLRQYPNCYGGHFHCNQAAFLRDHVIPLLQPPVTADAESPVARGKSPDSVRSAGFQSVSRRSALDDLPTLPPLEADDAPPMPVRSGPPPRAGRGGIAPISNNLRLP
jgi:pimeloyl-ACP methyl ester carboxylesterase